MHVRYESCVTRVWIETINRIVAFFIYSFFQRHAQTMEKCWTALEEITSDCLPSRNLWVGRVLILFIIKLPQPFVQSSSFRSPDARLLCHFALSSPPQMSIPGFLYQATCTQRTSREPWTEQTQVRILLRTLFGYKAWSIVTWPTQPSSLEAGSYTGYQAELNIKA